MEKYLIIAFVVLVVLSLFLFGCSRLSKGIPKLQEEYNKLMVQAEDLAKVLCTHSEFSSAFWKNALGVDREKLPAEAYAILDRIDSITKEKNPEDLTPSEKGALLGLWLRFTYLVSEDIIKKVVPFMMKFVVSL